MPSTAVPSVKLGVTVSPPCTALSSVTVKAMESPSDLAASLTVTVAASSLLIVPVPVSVDVILLASVVPETASPTVMVSLASSAASSVVATLKVCSSSAVPVKLIPAVLAV